MTILCHGKGMMFLNILILWISLDTFGPNVDSYCRFYVLLLWHRLFSLCGPKWRGYIVTYVTIASCVISLNNGDGSVNNL
jgi:hypothetical protein